MQPEIGRMNSRQLDLLRVPNWKIIWRLGHNFNRTHSMDKQIATVNDVNLYIACKPVDTNAEFWLHSACRWCRCGDAHLQWKCCRGLVYFQFKGHVEHGQIPFKLTIIYLVVPHFSLLRLDDNHHCIVNSSNSDGIASIGNLLLEVSTL